MTNIQKCACIFCEKNALYQHRFCWKHECYTVDCHDIRIMNSNYCLKCRCGKNCNNSIYNCRKHRCLWLFCSKLALNNYNYCSKHICMYVNCKNRRSKNRLDYCTTCFITFLNQRKDSYLSVLPPEINDYILDILINNVNHK